MIKKLFKQNSFILGLVIGLIIPWVMLGIIYGIDYLLRIILKMPILIGSSTMQLIGIVGGVLTMRYYMINMKYDKTGKGILVTTFIYIIIFFVNEYILKW
jgi:hypothetical protein